MTYIEGYRTPRPGEMGMQQETVWQDLAYARLEWLYGPTRAYAIHRRTDPQTRADIAKWNNLGRRRVA